MTRTNKGRNKRRAASKHAKAQPPKVILCAVCGKGDGKYKCPKCRTPFCCVQCSKDHKAVCTAAAATESKAVSTSTGDNNSTNNNIESNYLPQKALKTTKPTKKRIRRTLSDGEESDSHDDEPGWNITPEMKDRIRQSTWLRKELQDGGLRQLIEQIDAASEDEDEEDEEAWNNNNKNTNHFQKRKHNNNHPSGNNANISARELALARTKHSHEKFASFVDRMLLTAGILQPAVDGGQGGGSGSAAGDLIELLTGEGPSATPLVLAPTPRLRSGMSDGDQNAGSDTGSDDEGSSSDDDDSEEDSDSDGDSSGSSGDSDENEE